MFYHCDGCSSHFSRQGDLIQHLDKSQSPLCMAARKSFQDKIRPLAKGQRRPSPHRCSSRLHHTARTARPQAEGSPAADPAGMPEVEPTEPFIGDFFGDNYVDEDFPFPDYDKFPEPATVDEESDSDSDDGVDVELNQQSVSEDPDPQHINSSQPQIFSPIPNEPHPSSTEENEAEINEGGSVQSQGPGETQSATAPGGTSIEDHSFLQSPLVHCTKFGGQAGQPIATPAGTQSGHNGYAEEVGTNKTDNIWEPFKSKLDWEVAQWAKLRGPGSTAFSELLALEGVIILI